MVTREAIAAALVSAGLNGTPTKTGPISAGDAWPVWQSTRWANTVPNGVRLATWNVLVALVDQGADATTAEGDPLIETVGAALVGAGLQIDQVSPGRTGTTAETPGTPVLVFAVHD